MSDVGSLAWLRATEGRLSRGDLARMMASGVRSQARLLTARAGAALGLNRDRLARLDLDAVPMPDSRLARDAEAEAAQSVDAPILAHSYRAYLWGMALAGHDRVRPDPELLYVAALLHDVGVREAAAGRTDACFTTLSVAAAERLGAPEVVSDAIARHVNPVVPVGAGAEARLLNAGTALDVVGLRKWELEPATIAAVLARHPRGDFVGALDPQFRAHAAAAPQCRVAALYRYGAFSLQLRWAFR